MNKPKNVLLLAYGFPPIGGGGVPRPLKMAKYLGDFGWNVHVLTVDPVYHVTLDPTLLEQLPSTVTIHRAKEWAILPRPAGSGQPATSHAAPARPSLLSRVKQAVLPMLKKLKPYLLIPDEQILWYPQALRLGRTILQQYPIDVIFSTSGPVTNHLIARRLAKEFRCKWIADFRDPWTQNMHRSGIAWRERLEEWMEARVMAEANAVTTVTATFAENFRRKHGKRIERLELIYNGFDAADFQGISPRDEVPDRFHAVYAGILYQKRNPRLLLRAVRELIDEGKVDPDRILFSFAGVFDYPGYSENMDCVRELDLTGQVRIVGNLPHKEALRLMKGANALLLIGDVAEDAGAYIPGKLYEYMGIGNPILALHMPGEAAEIIERFELGRIAHPLDKEAIKEAYLHMYRTWLQDQDSGSPASARDAAFLERVKPYERREQARQLAALMDELTEAAQVIVSSGETP